jgi:hypothetical protein
VKLTIRQMSWYKRRPDPREPKPVDVEIPDLKLIDEHRCEMFVVYDNGEKFCLSGRVNQNTITGGWAIHGIDPNGHECMVDIGM